MYLGELENLDKNDVSDQNKAKESRSSFIPALIFVGGALALMFALGKWFPEDRFSH